MSVESMIIIAKGIVDPLKVFAFTLIVSLPAGFILTLLGNARFFPLRWLVKGYTWLFRGTPLMLQLFFIFYGIGYLYPIDRIPAACLAFTLNYAAYFCEIFRGGLLSIDRGQYEAAKVLGLSRYKTVTKIVIPQMVKVVLPAIANETITLIKDTALITVIGIVEIIHLTKNIVNAEGSYILPYAFAACIYLLITFFLTFVFKKIEKRFMYE